MKSISNINKTILGLIVFQALTYILTILKLPNIDLDKDLIFIINPITCIILPNVSLYIYKNKLIKKSDKYYENTSNRADNYRLIFAIFSVLALILMYFGKFHKNNLPKMDLMNWTFRIILILGIFLGNTLFGIKQNKFIGFKNYFTNKNEKIWNITNRLGGYIMFWGGVICLIFSFILPKNLSWFNNWPISAYLTGILITLTLIVPFLYSVYLTYKLTNEKH